MLVIFRLVYFCVRSVRFCLIRFAAFCSGSRRAALLWSVLLCCVFCCLALHRLTSLGFASRRFASLRFVCLASLFSAPVRLILLRFALSCCAALRCFPLSCLVFLRLALLCIHVLIVAVCCSLLSSCAWICFAPFSAALVSLCFASLCCDPVRFEVVWRNSMCGNIAILVGADAQGFGGCNPRPHLADYRPRAAGITPHGAFLRAGRYGTLATTSLPPAHPSSHPPQRVFSFCSCRPLPPFCFSPFWEVPFVALWRRSFALFSGCRLMHSRNLYGPIPVAAEARRSPPNMLLSNLVYLFFVMV